MAWGGEGGEIMKKQTLEASQAQPGIINLLDKFYFLTKILRGGNDLIACGVRWRCESWTRPGGQVGLYYCSTGPGHSP